MTLYLSDLDADATNTNARMRSSKEKEFGHNFRKYAREYSEVTGIHGLRYVTEKRSRTEKIIWAVILLVSLGGCIYMIYEILYKYNNSPVVVSFATEDTPIFQIPFPAVTICPESKYSRKEFDYSRIYFKVKESEKNDTIDKLEGIDQSELKIFSYLNAVCEQDPDMVPKGRKILDDGFYSTIDELRPDPTTTLPLCTINDNNPIRCLEFFTPVIIDEGICYSFNIFDREEIFRNHVYQFSDYYQVPNKSKPFFEVETGYKSDAGVDSYPRRALASGADNSLTIFFAYNTNYTDYMCNSFFQGFRVLIHNPWDVPRVSKHYLRVPLNTVVEAAIEPELVTTSESVRRFLPKKRKCFMRDERSLKYFLEYSQSNCLLECETNFTLEHCGCVPFYMPRDNSTPICGLGSYDCVEEVQIALKKFELEVRLKGNSYCDCKPSCTELKFNVETSFSDCSYEEFFQLYSLPPELKNLNWSILQIYFKNEQFMTKERNELYGVSDLISNLGGLLGLFTGFSLISGVELIYFCSLRLFYNEKMYGSWSGPPT